MCRYLFLLMAFSFWSCGSSEAPALASQPSIPISEGRLISILLKGKAQMSFAWRAGQIEAPAVLLVREKSGYVMIGFSGEVLKKNGWDYESHPDFQKVFRLRGLSLDSFTNPFFFACRPAEKSCLGSEKLAHLLRNQGKPLVILNTQIPSGGEAYGLGPEEFLSFLVFHEAFHFSYESAFRAPRKFLPTGAAYFRGGEACKTDVKWREHANTEISFLRKASPLSGLLTEAEREGVRSLIRNRCDSASCWDFQKEHLEGAADFFATEVLVQAGVLSAAHHSKIWERYFDDPSNKYDPSFLASGTSHAMLMVLSRMDGVESWQGKFRRGQSALWQVVKAVGAVCEGVK